MGKKIKIHDAEVFFAVKFLVDSIGLLVGFVEVI